MSRKPTEEVAFEISSNNENNNLSDGDDIDSHESNNVESDDIIRLMSRLPLRPDEALSSRFLRSISGMCCQECGKGNALFASDAAQEEKERASSSELDNLRTFSSLQSSASMISPLVAAPMLHSNSSRSSIGGVEQVLADYIAACRMYGCEQRINAGILTTIRFSLPSLRVSGAFHDQDMLALVEVLLKHSNGYLSFIHRLDFTLAGKVGKNYRRYGFSSHGALALAKLLQTTKYVRSVLIPKHKIGPYGATALFVACAQNSSIERIGMRGCRIGGKGAMAFAELIPSSSKTGLLEVDLSANRIGPEATTAIERGLEERFKSDLVPVSVNLEGNHVFPQIMNAITHCLGVILSFVGGYLLSQRIKGLSKVHEISCAVYTTSLLALYLSSTLYHSFFSLQSTKYVFEVLDKCAIYILIAGSYTPFLQILLGDKPIWSVGLLAFIWACCLFGICVEAFLPTWKHRGVFSLSAYLLMGWSCMICLPEMMERLPQACLNLLVLGGVAYTVGVPFFVRNNNLDHAIWHLFVLSGSVFHWLAVYLYVAPLPLRTS